MPSDYLYIGKRHQLAGNLYYWRAMLKKALDRDDTDEIAYASLELNIRQIALDEFTKKYKAKLANVTQRGCKTKHVPDVLKVNEQYKIEPVSFIPSFD
jgi:hypothetical protein